MAISKTISVTTRVKCCTGTETGADAATGPGMTRMSETVTMTVKITVMMAVRVTSKIN